MWCPGFPKAARCEDVEQGVSRTVSTYGEGAPQRTPSRRSRSPRGGLCQTAGLRDSARFSGLPGFTLMELLVALGIFAMSIGLIADLFLTASRQQARTVVLSRMQGDARLVIETIARELREGTLDVGADVPAGILAIRGGDGERIQFRRVASGDETYPCPSGVAACVYIGRGARSDAIAWAPLTSGDVSVPAFDVWGAPAVDPNEWDATNNQYRADTQPRVTVHVRLSAVGARSGEASTIEAQTTVESRVYQR